MNKWAEVAITITACALVQTLVGKITGVTDAIDTLPWIARGTYNITYLITGYLILRSGKQERPDAQEERGRG